MMLKARLFAIMSLLGVFPSDDTVVLTRYMPCTKICCKSCDISVLFHPKWIIRSRWLSGPLKSSIWFVNVKGKSFISHVQFDFRIYATIWYVKKRKKMLIILKCFNSKWELVQITELNLMQTGMKLFCIISTILLCYCLLPPRDH